MSRPPGGPGSADPPGQPPGRPPEPNARGLAADPLDEPIELARLLSVRELDEAVASFAAVHDCGVAIVDAAGHLLARAGTVGAPAVEAAITYQGDVVGGARVDPESAGGPGADRAQVARHVAHIVELLLHQAHARRLTGVAHEAVIASSFAELTAKNKSLEAAVARLREADRAKSNFLATMSHELRTPLTSVIGYSEMLLEGLAGALTEDQREYVSTILGKADQLLQLITSVLDMSRAEGTSPAGDLTPVAMTELVESVIASFVPQADKRGVTIVHRVERSLRALGDRRQIRQVVWNLVSNAVKFTADHSEVGIAVRIGPLVPGNVGTHPDNRLGVHVEVADRGIGISRDALAHIFEPFFQVDSSSTRQYGGSGLGLALAKAYVEAHGGRIWVDSTPGQGSRFVASFPAVADDLRAALARPSP